LQVLGTLIVGTPERRQVGGVACIDRRDATAIGDRQRAWQRRTISVGEGHPGKGAGGIWRVAIAYAQYEGLTGSEVIGAA
jgi:hypothetical protein